MAGPVTQLEHGYWGNMANQVAETHKANVERLNRETSIYARRAMRKDQAVVKARAAQAMGVQPEEIGFCRNAAEGLQALAGSLWDGGACGGPGQYRFRERQGGQAAALDLRVAVHRHLGIAALDAHAQRLFDLALAIPAALVLLLPLFFVIRYSTIL